MRIVTYSWIATDSTGKHADIERAVLPTIIVARKRDGIAAATAVTLGWWRWGIGLIRTVVDDKK